MSLVINCLRVNPFVENTYIIHDSITKEGAIIDCGALTQNEMGMLISFIDNVGIKLKYLLNTHLHLDHCFGNYAAANHWNIKPLANKEDEFLIGRMREQALQFGITNDVEVQALAGYLNDGDSLFLGDEEIKVIATPGHSPGGLCFYAPQSKVLFSGDTLFNGSVGRTDLPGGSMSTLIRSIREKLLVLDDDVVVYPGHGGYTTIGYEKYDNPFL